MNSIQNEIHGLRQVARSFKINLKEHHIALLIPYVEELVKWNEKINLIGPLNVRRILMELVLDSLIPAPYISPNYHLLDIGSGAGFPGIPIKIYFQTIPITLMDSSLKKVTFLRYIVRKLGLKDISVINARGGKDNWEYQKGGYGIITAKALAPLNEAIKICLPYLSEDGSFIYYGGKIKREDINETLGSEYGLLFHQNIEYTLPGMKSKRNILILKKRKNPLP